MEKKEMEQQITKIIERSRGEGFTQDEVFETVSIQFEDIPDTELRPIFDALYQSELPKPQSLPSGELTSDDLENKVQDLYRDSKPEKAREDLILNEIEIINSRADYADVSDGEYYFEKAACKAQIDKLRQVGWGELPKPQPVSSEELLTDEKWISSNISFALEGVASCTNKHEIVNYEKIADTLASAIVAKISPKTSAKFQAEVADLKRQIRELEIKTGSCKGCDNYYSQLREEARQQALQGVLGQTIAIRSEIKAKIRAHRGKNPLDKSAIMRANAQMKILQTIITSIKINGVMPKE